MWIYAIYHKDDKDGSIICDPESVLKIWKTAFQSLFCEDHELEPNIEVKIRERMLDDSIYLKEMVMNDPLCEQLEMLNTNFTIEDVEKAIMNTKKVKQLG